MKRYLLNILILLSPILAMGQEVRISEVDRKMATYSFSDPDPVARPGRIYPYFRFDGYATTPVEKSWKMVVMENEWIKIWIAPGLGGKIYGAQEKSTGQYFIYHNDVVKFRDIAMRGAWTSGGIEVNFGSIGHAPTTATPVDYFTRNNPDGSVSCFLGSYDLTSRTEWRIEVIMYPDRAYFRTRGWWVNPGVKSTSLYHWMNAAADTGDDLRYYFPGTTRIDHSGNSFPWPVNEDGVDISYYANNNYGGDHSYHVLGKYTDWFAGYWGSRDFGFGHWSRYPVKAGKKIWLWALSRQGGIWEGLLTDTAGNNGQYTEIQTGMLYNQAASGSTFSPFKHMAFSPGSVQRIDEVWFPVLSTGGVATASEKAVANILHRGDSVSLMVCPIARMRDTLHIFDGEKLLRSVPVDLEPMRTIEIFAGTSPIDLKVSSTGKSLEINIIEESDFVLDRPRVMEEFDWESIYGLYTLGLEQLKQRQYDQAESYTRRCIASDKYYMPAYTLLAEIQYHRLKHDSARINVDRVLSFDTYDADANFISGALYEENGDLMKALDAYGIAMKYEKYRDASLQRIALIALKLEKPEAGVELLRSYEPEISSNPETARLMLVSYRMLGWDSLFSRQVIRNLKVDPLDHFTRFEKYLKTGLNEDRDSLLRYIRGEFPYQNFLEMATWYIRAGLNDDAASLLQLAPENVLVNYYRAWLAYGRNDQSLSKKFLEEALRASTDFVFPFRDETEKVLLWAQEQDDSWKNQYYLSLVYWNRGRIDEARQLLDAIGNKPSEYYFYLARGDFYLSIDSIAAERDYREALNRGKNEWRVYHRLINYYLSLGFLERAKELSSKIRELSPENYITSLDHARVLLATGKYTETVDLLSELEILPYEGARQGREVWRRANLMAALESYWSGSLPEARQYIDGAYSWPENLGVGKPYDVDERMEDFINAMITAKEGRFDASRELYRGIIDKGGTDHSGKNSDILLTVLAMRELNRDEDADTLFNNWLESENDERVRNWAQSLYQGEYERAASFASMKAVPEKREPWEQQETVDDLSLINAIVLQYLKEKW